jgi:single-strand DNA-binding protein
MNKAILEGYLGGDAVVRTGKNNKPFTTLSLATQEVRKNSETGKYTNVPEWHNLIVSGKRGEYAAKLKKGGHILIEGKIEHPVYKGVKKDQIRVQFLRNLDRAEQAAPEEEEFDEIPDEEVVA